MRRALAWLWFLLLAVLLFFASTLLARRVTPEELAFLLGLVGFFLLANPLIFGYAALLNFIAAAEQGRARLEDAWEMLGTPPELRVEREAATLAVLGLRALAPYRYAYYGLLLLLLLLVVTPQLAAPPFAWGGTMIGLLWGAAVPTVLVFSLEVAASWRLAGLLQKEKAT